MILWFGKKKKKQELEAEGKRIEAEEAARKAAAQAEAEVKATAAKIAGEEAQAGAALANETAQLMAAEEVPDPAAEAAPIAEPDAEPEIIAHAASPEDVAFDVDQMPALVTQPDPEPIDDVAVETKSPGFFSKLATGLKRSSSKLSDGITGVFTKRKLDEETLEELEDLLIMSDMGTAVARRVTQNIAKDRFEKEISDEEIKTALASEISQIMRPREQVVDFADGPRPRIVCLLYTSPSPRDQRGSRMPSSA